MPAPGAQTCRRSFAVALGVAAVTFTASGVGGRGQAHDQQRPRHDDGRRRAGVADHGRVGTRRSDEDRQRREDDDLVSLELVDMPERQALDILLRSASGYMVAERQTPVAGASAFDRIMILPFSRPPGAVADAGDTSMPPPFTNRPDDAATPDDDDASAMPPG